MERRAEFEFMQTEDPVADLDRLVDLLLQAYNTGDDRPHESLRSLQDRVSHPKDDGLPIDTPATDEQ